MKITKIVLPVALFLSNFTFAQTPATDPHWILDQNLSDEFSYTGSQSTILSQMRNKWHFLLNEINPSCDAYTSSLLGVPVVQSWGYVNTSGSDILVNNGICTLSAKFAPGYYEWPSTDTVNHPFHFPVYYYYTRCQLVSLASMHYGFYELKFKLPHYPNHPEYLDGIGANMWLYRESYPNPQPQVAYSELDVFEQAPLNQYIFAPTIHAGQNGSVIQNSIYPNIGWEARIAEWDAPFNYYVNFSDGQFHTLGFEWQKEYIAIYWDGNLIRSMNFRQDIIGSMNLILDLNVNPYFQGLNPGITLNTHFPYEYKIDYLRYYNFNTSNMTNLSVCSSNFANVNSSNNLGYTYRDNITLGGTGCSSAKVQSGSDLVLRAKSSITLDEGFECDEYTTMYLQVSER